MAGALGVSRGTVLSETTSGSVLGIERLGNNSHAAFGSSRNDVSAVGDHPVCAGSSLRRRQRAAAAEGLAPDAGSSFPWAGRIAAAVFSNRRVDECSPRSEKVSRTTRLLLRRPRHRAEWRGRTVCQTPTGCCRPFSHRQPLPARSDLIAWKRGLDPVPLPLALAASTAA